MALKATVYKATLDLSDLDRNVYGEHSLTLARHPSETDERMLVRLLVYALHLPEDNSGGTLEFAKDLWEADEPALWQHNLIGGVAHWIEVGQPDERRLSRVCARSERVTVYAFSASANTWWRGLANQITRLRNLTVRQIPAEQSAELATLAERSMQLQVTVQDGGIWVSAGERSVEITPQTLFGQP